jgi:iron complex transport system ATP-binding protein
MIGLRVHQVTLGYGDQIVLSGVSLEVNPGEMVGIIGANGSGKSTLIKAVSGVLSPRAGKIYLNGRELSRLSRQNLARLVAVVPQNPFLPEAFTALEVVLLGRYPHLGLFRYESERDLGIAWEALERTGIGSLAQRRVSQLSGGERQRLIIARALAQEPQVILLDEPTAHLDIQHQLEVMELIQSLVQEGVAALVALHDFSLAARFCQRLLLLKDGNVWAEGTPEAVLTPENIQAAFGINAVVYPDPFGGRLVVSPFRKRVRGEFCHVHVIGGGGRGGKVLQMLHAEGFVVSTGVLNEGDTDLAIARALGLEAVAVSPFATIDEGSHQRNLRLIARADCTVVADVPFGKANFRNLEAAATAERLFLIQGTPIEQRDFTGGIASELYHRLKQRASCITYNDMLSSIEEALIPKQGVA